MISSEILKNLIELREEMKKSGAGSVKAQELIKKLLDSYVKQYESKEGTTKKITAPDQWAEKFLREALWMPFGSLCNLIGLAHQGKGIGIQDFELFARKAFELSLEFTERAYERVQRSDKNDEPDIPLEQ
jgi:hypothetical protein